MPRGFCLDQWKGLLWGSLKNRRRERQSKQVLLQTPRFAWIMLAEVSPYEKTFVQPSSTISEYDIAFVGIRGVILGGVYETLLDSYRNSTRKSAYLKLNLITFINFEYWLRYETGSRNLNDSFFIVHVYADI